MAQKKNKDRKQELLNYKNKIKNRMSEKKQVQPPKPLRNYPVWKSQDKIDVTGLEWEKIYNTLNMFREAIIACESVMQRNSASGVISTKFIDENNNEVAPEEVEKYTKELQAYFASQAASQAEDGAPSPQTSPILTEAGEQQEASNSTSKKSELKAV